jgi:hypothetical protein
MLKLFPVNGEKSPKDVGYKRVEDANVHGKILLCGWEVYTRSNQHKTKKPSV